MEKKILQQVEIHNPELLKTYFPAALYDVVSQLFIDISSNNSL